MDCVVIYNKETINRYSDELQEFWAIYGASFPDETVFMAVAIAISVAIFIASSNKA